MCTGTKPVDIATAPGGAGGAGRGAGGGGAAASGAGRAAGAASRQKRISGGPGEDRIIAPDPKFRGPIARQIALGNTSLLGAGRQVGGRQGSL